MAREQVLAVLFVFRVPERSGFVSAIVEALVHDVAVGFGAERIRVLDRRLHRQYPSPPHGGVSEHHRIQIEGIPNRHAVTDRRPVLRQPAAHVPRTEDEQSAAALAELELARRRPYPTDAVEVLDVGDFLLGVAENRRRHDLADQGDGDMPRVAARGHHVGFVAVGSDYFFDEVSVVEVRIEPVCHPLCLLALSGGLLFSVEPPGQVGSSEKTGR